MQEPDRRQESRLPDYQDLVTDFSGRVYRQALRILGTRQDAEDATQEVFLKIYNGLGSFRGESHVSTWIFRITFNVCVTMRQKRRADHVSIHDSGEGRLPEIPDPNDSPDEELAGRERLDRLALKIAQLPVREAAAITLFYIEQKSYAEISDILAIPPGSVATALHNGRDRLKRLLKEDRE